jgi:hypothetical protein
MPMLELIFGFVFCMATVACVALANNWAIAGVVAPLHLPVVLRDLRGVDWLNIGFRYVAMLACIGIDAYVLGKLPRWLRFAALALVPFIILAYWFLTDNVSSCL